MLTLSLLGDILCFIAFKCFKSQSHDKHLISQGSSKPACTLEGFPPTSGKSSLWIARLSLCKCFALGLFWFGYKFNWLALTRE